MKRFIQTVVLLLTLLVLAAVLMSTSAQADPPAPLGPEPLLPCTRPADEPAASPLAALEAWLAQLREIPFDPHVEDLARCYPLRVEPDVMPMFA